MLVRHKREGKPGGSASKAPGTKSVTLSSVRAYMLEGRTWPLCMVQSCASAATNCGCYVFLKAAVECSKQPNYHEGLANNLKLKVPEKGIITIQSPWPPNVLTYFKKNS